MLHKAETRALDLKTDFRQRKQKELLNKRKSSLNHHVVAGFTDDVSVQNLPDASFIDVDINREEMPTR